MKDFLMKKLPRIVRENRKAEPIVPKEATDNIKDAVIPKPVKEQVLIPANSEAYRGISIYDKASEIGSSIETSWCDKGLTLSELGQFENALDFYDKALEINPKSTKALKSKAKRSLSDWQIRRSHILL